MVSTNSDKMVAVDHKKSLPFLHRYHLLLKLRYFLFFFGFGAIYPIASITLSSRGLTTLEISYINLIIPFLIFVTNPFSDLLADRSGRFRLTFNIALCLTLIFYGILFILPSIKTYNISGKMYQMNQLGHTLNFCANEELAIKCASRSECGCYTYQANCTSLTRRNNFNENSRGNMLKFNFSMNSKYVEKEMKNVSTNSKQSSLSTIDYRVSIDQSLAKYTKNGSHRSSLNGNSHLANCEITCTVAHFCHGSRYPRQIVYILLYSLAFIIGGSLFTNCVTIGTSIGFSVLSRQDLFGRQRVWGTIGSGLSALIASRLYEHFKTEYYLFLYIDEVAGCQSHSIIGWMTLISAMSEVVAFFLAHQLLRRLGTNISSILIMLAFAIRFSGYYFIRRPYLILLMETMHFFNSGRGIGLVISLFLYVRFEKRLLFLVYAIFNLAAASLCFLLTKQCSLLSTEENNISLLLFDI